MGCVNAVCLYVIVFLLYLTIFSLFIKIDGSTIGFLRSTVKTGITGFHAILVVTSYNIMLNTVVSSKVVSVTQRNVVDPSRFAFRRIVALFLTIVIASIVVLSIFGALNVPASAAISLIFRLLKNTFVLTALGVCNSSDLGCNILLGDGGTLRIVVNVFSSIVVTFMFNTFIV